MTLTQSEMELIPGLLFLAFVLPLLALWKKRRDR